MTSTKHFSTSRVVIVGSGKTLEDDANFTYDGGQLKVGTGLSVTGLSTFVGVGTFISDLYVGGDLFISENISLDYELEEGMEFNFLSTEFTKSKPNSNPKEISEKDFDTDDVIFI